MSAKLRSVYWFVLGAALVGLSIASLSWVFFPSELQGTARWAAIRSLQVGYDWVDDGAAYSLANTGPKPVSSLAVYQQGKIAQPPVPFAHEPYDSSGVTKFRRRLVDLIPPKPEQDLFEFCNALRSHSEHAEMVELAVSDNPFQILKELKNHQPLTCRYFALALISGCTQQGYCARLLGLSSRGTNWEHAVAEVYLPQFRRWVLIDPDFNVAYRRRGEWLHAAELHQAWSQLYSQLPSDFAEQAPEVRFRRIQELTGIEIVKLGPAGTELWRGDHLRGGLTLMNLELFEYVAYAWRNDYLSNTYPPGYPNAVTQTLLKRTDASWPSICPEAYACNNLEELYWPVGTVKLQVLDYRSKDNREQLTVQLGTYTPNFARFELRLDQSDWQPIPKLPAIISITDAHILSIRSVNQFKVAGTATTVLLSRIRQAALSRNN